MYVRDDNDKGCHDRARLIVSRNVLSRRTSSFLEVKLRYFDSQATDTIAELETQVNQLKQALQDSEFQRQRQLRVRNVHTFPLCVFVCFFFYFSIDDVKFLVFLFYGSVVLALLRLSRFAALFLNRLALISSI